MNQSNEMSYHLTNCFYLILCKSYESYFLRLIDQALKTYDKFITVVIIIRIMGKCVGSKKESGKTARNV